MATLAESPRTTLAGALASSHAAVRTEPKSRGTEASASSEIPTMVSSAQPSNNPTSTAKAPPVTKPIRVGVNVRLGRLRGVHALNG